MTTPRCVQAKVIETDGSPYLFTFSPICNTKNAEFCYYDHLSTYFAQWHRCMKEFEVNPEFNANGNLHYHGYFVIKDKFRWHAKVLPKMKYNGMVKISKVKCSLADGVVYCRKDRILMQRIIKAYPVPYTHNDSHIFKEPDMESNTIEKYIKQLCHDKKSDGIQCEFPSCDKKYHDLDQGICYD